MHVVNDEPTTGKVDWAEKFPHVFSEGPGKYTGPKVHINKRPDCKPVFMRERTLPYAIKDDVRKTIDKMVEDNILTPTTSSEWATPIVPVRKRDGTIRICGDFRNTVNKNISCDVYPLPSLEDMLQKLMPGKVFSKLDLSQAYLQLVLDEESSEMCTLNTVFGLYKMNRLAYGVSSGPAIFQKTIEQLFKDIPNVALYIDDIVISGATQEEHDETVMTVLRRLSDAGLVLKRENASGTGRL